MVINNLHIAELSSQFLLLILVELSSKVLLKSLTLFCFFYFLHLASSTPHYPYFLITSHSFIVSFGWILFTLWPLNFGVFHGSVLCRSYFVICTYSFGDLWITMIPLVSLWSRPLSKTLEMYPATYLSCSLRDFQFNCPNWTPWPHKPAPPTTFLIAIRGSTILSCSFSPQMTLFFSSSQSPCPTSQDIFLILPSKYVQDQTLSHYP